MHNTSYKKTETKLFGISVQQEINYVVCSVAATLVNDCPVRAEYSNAVLNTDTQRATDLWEATLPPTCVNAALQILSADDQATCYHSVITLNIEFNKDGQGLIHAKHRLNH